MIKLIIFDLDGVLVDAKNIHFKTLNKSLGDYQITWDEHIIKYDGLKTKQKLELLHKEKGLPIELFDKVWSDKQKYTLESLKDLKESPHLSECIDLLISDGYKLAVCSNSVRKTVLTVLSKLNIIDKFDLILSNEDVINSKPHPEIYWKTISKMGCLPDETVIIEDSPYGLLSAHRTNSQVFRVTSPKDVTYSNIKNFISSLKKKPQTPQWVDKKLNVLIPMAGAGSRFCDAGYSLPKPLINVNGKPMIQVVVENINIDANYIYIIQKQHREKYNLDTVLNIITPNCRIVEVDGLTEGAACTSLISKELINNENPLFFANSDQFVEWDSNEFMYKMQESNCDGGIPIFKSTHPKWSFAKIGDDGFVTNVAEKNPISDNATVGFYYWKHGSDFVDFAEDMIKKNIRVNNEFYVCPVFNQAISKGKKIKVFEIKKMWGLGTPEDLTYFIKNH